MAIAMMSFSEYNKKRKEKGRKHNIKKNKKSKNTDIDSCKQDTKKNAMISFINDMTNIRQYIKRFLLVFFCNAVLFLLLGKSLRIFHCSS